MQRDIALLAKSWLFRILVVSELIGAAELWGVADCSTYRTYGFATLSEAMRNHSNETKTISAILKTIRRKN